MRPNCNLHAVIEIIVFPMEKQWCWCLTNRDRSRAQNADKTSPATKSSIFHENTSFQWNVTKLQFARFIEIIVFYMEKQRFLHFHMVQLNRPRAGLVTNHTMRVVDMLATVLKWPVLKWPYHGRQATCDPGSYMYNCMPWKSYHWLNWWC